MVRVKLKFTVLFCFIVSFSLWFSVNSFASNTSTALKPKRVLAIFVFKQGLPWTNHIEESMRATITAQIDYPIELNIEHADQSRFPEADYRAKIIDLYRYKYSNQDLDLVLGVGDESTDLLLEHGKELFGNIPMVLVTTKQKKVPPRKLQNNMVSLQWGFDFAKTGSVIHQILPKTKHLFVISGTSITDHRLKDLAADALDTKDSPFKIHYLDNLSAEELLEKVTRLPKHSAIFFLSLFNDRTGKAFVPRNIVPKVAQNANGPTFGIVDLYLGHGIVGGNLLSASHQGQKYAEIIDKILTGTSVQELLKDNNASQMLFDWRELKRWSINESKLPDGAVIRFRQPSFWDDYKWQIIAINIIILAQAFALLGLIIQHKRRRLAEQESQRLKDECTHISRVMTMGEIVASLAHELNQPLTATRSYAQAAQRFLGNSPANPCEASKAIDGVIAGNRRAEEVIKRIRMTLKKEPFKQSPIEIGDLVQEVIILIQSKVKEQNIILRVEPNMSLPRILGDPVQLQQVLFNLILNGIESIPDDYNTREITIKTTLNKETNVVIISVVDTGIGIDNEHEKVLFDAFHTTKIEGMGMGLSISRSIIEDHGGRIWATPNPQEGTTFSFTAPIYKESK